MRMQRWRKRAVAVALAFAGAAGGLSGCGLAAQRTPEVLDPKSAPQGLFGASPTTSTAVPGLGVTPVTVYLEGKNERLVAVQADVPWPAAVGAALAALGQSPTAAESARGLVSPASSVGPLTAGPLHHGVATVDLPTSFENLDGQDQVVAVAQVVFTLTAFPDIRGVAFLVGHQATQVPNEGGKLVAGPLTRSDYPGLGN